MAGTALDMTSPRSGAAGAVYGIYGAPDPSAVTLSALLAAGTVLRQIPLNVLTALETGSLPLARGAGIEHAGGSPGTP